MTAYRTNWGCIVVVSLIVGLIGGAGGAYWFAHTSATGVGGGPSGQVGSAVPVPVEYEQSSIVKAVAKDAPGVVTITATSVVQQTTPFGLPFGPGAERHSLGSGFFFDFNGKQYILTNTHVIAGAQELTVRMSNGDQFSARKLGASPEDLAVIEPINGPAHPPVLALGNSDRIPVGAWVIAVGSPFGFSNTVTVGVVSHKGPIQIGDTQSSMSGEGPAAAMASRDLIQTDAAINEGNSGGPLIDTGGNVIAVNEMIFSPTQTNLGIGWAIPINKAKELMTFLINGGPWIGVTTLANSPGLARRAGLQTGQGLLIYRVVSDSPAATAGLREGDVILQVDAVAIKTPDDLQKAILAHKIGDRITFVIQRGQAKKTLTVEAGRVPQGLF
jgi:serine protease Do